MNRSCQRLKSSVRFTASKQLQPAGSGRRKYEGARALIDTVWRVDKVADVRELRKLYCVDERGGKAEMR